MGTVVPLNAPLPLAQVLGEDGDGLLKAWRASFMSSADAGADNLLRYGSSLIAALRTAAIGGFSDNLAAPEWMETRHVLEGLARERAVAGFTASETAIFVFSLKSPLAALMRARGGDDGASAADVMHMHRLLDALGLYTAEVLQKAREEVIVRQQREILELSTPVMRLWRGILLLPLVGVLDSTRTQVVMDSLLQQIVDDHARVAIIDIAGVPIVDTLVAQHLVKTMAAAALMGADCLISGIRPQIAQTLVHLGVDLKVESTATLASAFARALKKLDAHA